MSNLAMEAAPANHRGAPHRLGLLDTRQCLQPLGLHAPALLLELLHKQHTGATMSVVGVRTY